MLIALALSDIRLTDFIVASKLPWSVFHSSSKDMLMAIEIEADEM